MGSKYQHPQVWIDALPTDDDVPAGSLGLCMVTITRVSQAMRRQHGNKAGDRFFAAFMDTTNDDEAWALIDSVVKIGPKPKPTPRIATKVIYTPETRTIDFDDVATPVRIGLERRAAWYASLTAGCRVWCGCRRHGGSRPELNQYGSPATMVGFVWDGWIAFVEVIGEPSPDHMAGWVPVVRHDDGSEHRGCYLTRPVDADEPGMALPTL